jgi:hypothetical protein
MRAYLVDTRPYEGIVAEVSTDICCDDLAVDAVLGNEILVCTGGARGPVPVSVAISSVSARHDERREEVEVEVEVEVEAERIKKEGRENEFTSRRKLCTMGQRQPKGRQAKSKKQRG